MYVGIHLPKSEKRHRRGKKHKKIYDEANGKKEGKDSILSEQPSTRIKFLLGDEAEEGHETHEIFTEMEELFQLDDDEAEWKETARWIKYEEEVDAGADRWSKPHVSSLPLHSLFELRSCILTGAVCLDMEAETLEQIAGLVLDKLIATYQLEEEKREQVREALLRRHRHQSEKKHRERKISKTGNLTPNRSLLDIGRSFSHKSMEQALEDTSKKGSDNKLDKKSSDHKLERKSSLANINLPRIASANSIKVRDTKEDIFWRRYYK
ncbi:sodium bicarbonate cotransporter 3-like [Amphiura filiformis]|uniref:sodium bicarbonate cotransporter 3-like n=1 Tax=Amphiura filiformis TaxID=82378 RepID=UPI003B211618